MGGIIIIPPQCQNGITTLLETDPFISKVYKITRATCTIVAKGNYFLSSTYKYEITKNKKLVTNNK